MNEIVSWDKNPLFFLDNNESLIEYTDRDLAGEIFEVADQAIRRRQQEVLSSLMAASPAVAELANGMKKTHRLKLVFSDDIKKKLEEGIYHLMEKKDNDGVFKAVVVDKDGKIVKLADLKWEEIMQGVDPAKLTSAMQGMAIQQQLKDISVQLEEMSSAMEAILIGQHNDRLSSYYSGESIFREALAMKDLELRKQLTASAILSLTTAISALQASLAYEIRFVCEKYDKTKDRFVGVKSDVLLDKMFVINSSFQTIHKAVSLKAAIYYKDGEYSALATVLTEYQRFLEKSLCEDNAHILYLADPTAKKLDGTWNMRKNQLPERIEKAKELLGTPSEYALEAKKEDLL